MSASPDAAPRVGGPAAGDPPRRMDVAVALLILLMVILPRGEHGSPASPHAERDPASAVVQRESVRPRTLESEDATAARATPHAMWANEASTDPDASATHAP